MSESFPTRPGDLPDTATVVDLAKQVTTQQLTLLAHHYGVDQLDGETLRATTLAALACRTALVAEAASGQWLVAADALAAGATVEQVAAAMDTHPDDLPVFLASWAAKQRRHGLISGERYEQVLGLLAGEVQS